MNVIVIVDQDYDVVSVITVTTEKAFPKVKERYMEQFREILKRYKESILPNVFTNIEEFYNGDSFLNLSTVSFTAFITIGISSILFVRPSVSTIEPCASSCFKPIANKVCDGSNVFEEQAEPVAI